MKTSDFRRPVSNMQWTLETDMKLLQFLGGFRDKIMARTTEVTNAVDDLVFEAKAVDVSIHNAMNNFNNLAHKQFVENRVYLDDETAEKKKEEPLPDPAAADGNSTEQTIKKFTEAVSLGLGAMKKSPFWVAVESDPAEDAPEAGKINPYLRRKLPFIVGTAEYHDDDRCGLDDEDYFDEDEDGSGSDSDLSSDFSDTSDEDESTVFDSDDSYSDTESSYSESSSFSTSTSSSTATSSTASSSRSGTTESSAVTSSTGSSSRTGTTGTTGSGSSSSDSDSTDASSSQSSQMFGSVKPTPLSPAARLHCRLALLRPSRPGVELLKSRPSCRTPARTLTARSQQTA